MGLEELKDGERLDVQEAGAGMDVVGFVFECCCTGEGDGLLAAEDLAEDGGHDDVLGQ